MKKYTIRAKITEAVESEYEVIEAGTICEGYLNSWHLIGGYSMQVEMQCESGGVSSGICVVMAQIDGDTIESVQEKQEAEQ